MPSRPLLGARVGRHFLPCFPSALASPSRATAPGLLPTFRLPTGAEGFGGDGGPAAAAQLYQPSGIALDSGTLYIADTGNHRVRRVDLATGMITTIAGTGVGGFGGDGGAATAAQLFLPVDLAVGEGGLYIVDRGNNRVRLVKLE